MQSFAMENGELGEIVQGYARIDDAISVPTRMLRWAKGQLPGLLRHDP